MISTTYLILKTGNINHVFHVKKELAQIGYRQDFHGEAESEHNDKKDNSYRNEKRKRIIHKIFKHLNQPEKPKFRVENRVTFEKFRYFVVLEDQYYWMYQ